jgi:Tol biopolymer transport system component
VIARRVTGLALLLLSLASGSCRSSNITGAGAGAGGVVLFASNRGGRNFEIYRVAGDGRALQRIYADPDRNNFAPALSHDGARIAWEREVRDVNGNIAAEIWVMNSDGSDAHAVVSNGTENRTPAWMPGDSAIVYASYQANNWDIYRVALRAGAAPVPLTTSPYADQYPRVSPDGSKIAFQTNRDLNFEIYVMNADGTGAHNLTNSPSDDRFPAWSPDGSRIVWSRFVDSFDIYAMDAATGANQTPIVATPFSESNPSVSPDGSSVVFSSERGGTTQLYVAPFAAGSTVRALTTPPSATSSPQSPSDQAPWWSSALK